MTPQSRLPFQGNRESCIGKQRQQLDRWLHCTSPPPPPPPYFPNPPSLSCHDKTFTCIASYWEDVCERVEGLLWYSAAIPSYLALILACILSGCCLTFRRICPPVPVSMDCHSSPHNHKGAHLDPTHATSTCRRMLPEMPRRSILRVLGTFDEESCRFFLRETGEAIVPYFPFSIGIENVYGLLLERYGLGEIADATSVLHELLEDQTSATGIGDDGDVWRSWRHQWRHRNVSVPIASFLSH